MHVTHYNTLITAVKEVIANARQFAYRSNNGRATLKSLSKQLTLEFGKGFDESNLRNIRQFYLAFQKRDALRHELSWTHYRMISRIENEELRLKYVHYAIEGNWDTRALQRNIQTQYIGRILAPQVTSKPVPQNLLKDPYILEFLGMPADKRLTENLIESALIDHLQQFLMELGKGFAFVARQEHVVTDTSDFYIDLVFYNYFLKCFVLIDLKTDKLTHSAIGQMDMYVRMYNDIKASEGDNPTIGIILCTEKDETIVKYSVLAENEKLFASKYRLYLPKEEELARLIEADRENLNLTNDRNSPYLTSNYNSETHPAS
jgi:predicted nuclease of restriction endonuclease-like (RecB) superfamily